MTYYVRQLGFGINLHIWLVMVIVLCLSSWLKWASRETAQLVLWFLGVKMTHHNHHIHSKHTLKNWLHLVGRWIFLSASRRDASLIVLSVSFFLIVSIRPLGSGHSVWLSRVSFPPRWAFLFAASPSQRGTTCATAASQAPEIVCSGPSVRVSVGIITETDALNQ